MGTREMTPQLIAVTLTQDLCLFPGTHFMQFPTVQTSAPLIGKFFLTYEGTCPCTCIITLPLLTAHMHTHNYINMHTYTYVYTNTLYMLTYTSTHTRAHEHTHAHTNLLAQGQKKSYQVGHNLPKQLYQIDLQNCKMRVAHFARDCESCAQILSGAQLLLSSCSLLYAFPKQ